MIIILLHICVHMRVGVSHADTCPFSSPWDSELISTLVLEHTLKNKVQLSGVLVVLTLMQRQLLVPDQGLIIPELGRDGTPR